MDIIQTGWFTEVSTLWPNQRFSVKVKKLLIHETSQYQDILIFDSEEHGRFLVLDGIIQCSESDEFSYQEMMSFLPLNSHPNPKHVLIIGGGDGGMAREVSKHPLVEKIVQVEIDERVIELCKRYLPFMAEGFNSPKLSLIIADGLKYLLEHADSFDVIITDSSDPIGPAVQLFTSNYFKLLKKALKQGGVICSQAGNAFNCVLTVKNMVDVAKSVFANVAYAYSMVPTYPSGQIGYLLASDSADVDFKKPVRVFTEDEKQSMNLRYYDEHIHNAAFQLPRFIRSSLSL